ncbi:GTPase [Dokdonia sp. Dokd-P16]|uniref:GTPase n=1 Tax=Dokdonia sp. Dokd-P16 TaxID=2173169 RepID=UPI000D54A43C|nr:GTPase [Dokdonia sp. Dokd-P16]AWH75627.1 GTPase [Dokdonia sp. Dokd-P16]
MKLLFVYNANSGKLNALMDSAHKWIRPETYECDLCSLTFGVFKEKEEWLRFRESVKTPLEFLHKDEFLKAYKSKWLPKYEFPVVLAVTEAGLEVVISADAFTGIASSQELIEQVNKIIESY